MVTKENKEQVARGEPPKTLRRSRAAHPAIRLGKGHTEDTWHEERKRKDLSLAIIIFSFFMSPCADSGVSSAESCHSAIMSASCRSLVSGILNLANEFRIYTKKLINWRREEAGVRVTDGGRDIWKQRRRRKKRKQQEREQRTEQKRICKYVFGLWKRLSASVPT